MGDKTDVITLVAAPHQLSIDIKPRIPTSDSFNILVRNNGGTVNFRTVKSNHPS